MGTRPTHYNTRYKHDLTPRQCEVMDLLALGRTNAEIAERMGLTLDGAKWHVREILSKLNLESREEAASYWHNYNRPLGRISREVSSLALLATLKTAIIGGATVAAVVAAFATIVFLSGDDGAAPATPAVTSGCDLADVRLESSAVAAVPYVEISVTAFVSQTCRLTGGLAVSVQDGPSIIVPEIMAVDRLIEPSGTRIAKGLWANWCGNLQIPDLVSQMGTARGSTRLRATPSCLSFVEPSVLSLVVPEASSFVLPPAVAAPTLTAVESRALLYARQTADLINANNIDAILANAVGQPHVCGPAKTREGEPACDGVAEGTEAAGYRITLHGSHGTLENRAGFEPEVRKRVTPDLTLASIGCATADRLCLHFIVAFKAQDPIQPAVVYLVFDQPIAGGALPRLFGMGLSGDNADTILNGGVTMTDLGETRFVAVK